MLTLRSVEVRPRELAETYGFLFKGMVGAEGLGRPFWFEVELLSTNGRIDKRALLGQSMAVAMTRDDGQERFFNGVITELTQTGSRGEHFTYRACLRPRLALLAHKTDSRIFQPATLVGAGGAITVLDIVKSVLDEHHVDVSYQNVPGASGRLNEHAYVVQYQESDLDFVSRLLEREGLNYYFVHTADRHQLVLADQTADFYRDGADYVRIPFLAGGAHAAAELRDRDHIDAWETRVQVQPERYEARDFDFEAPSATRKSIAATPAHPAPVGGEIYEYPARYPTDPQIEGGLRHEYAKRRLEEQRLGAEQAVGGGSARALAPGVTFALTGYSGEPEDRKFLVMWTEYALSTSDYASGGGEDAPDYRVKFGAMDVRLQYRPPVRTPRPVVTGPQTAIVVGAPDSEITTDVYGRVKVKFPWDRTERRDDTSSCFVRVAQVWAGARWGALFMPRVGQEVIVDFLEGDPDQPIIVGRVYNKERPPPYDPRVHPTVSTIKSMSSPGGGGFNELRFEDRKGSEQLFLHAQRRMDVRVGASLHETVRGNRDEIVGHDDKGDLNRLVHNDINAHARGGQFEQVDKKRHQNVKDEVVEVFEANHTVAVTNRQTLNARETAIEAKQTLSLKGDTVVVQGGQSLSLKAGNVKIEGTQSISLKVGGNFVVLTAGGVFINGAMVMLNSGGAAQPADEPLVIEDPTLELPAAPTAADSALPGEHHGHGGGVGAPQGRVARSVKLQRAPEPPPAPRVSFEGLPVAASDRAVLTMVWLQAEATCGAQVGLRGTTRGYPDGATETIEVVNAADGTSVGAIPVTIQGNAFKQTVDIKDWLPRQIGPDFETVRDEHALVLGRKTPRPLRMKFFPSLEPADCTLTNRTGMTPSHFRMGVRNYVCEIEGRIDYVRGLIGQLIQLGNSVPEGTGGAVPIDLGPANPETLSGRDWRFAKYVSDVDRQLLYWDGSGKWKPVSSWQDDPRGTKLFSQAVWPEGNVSRLKGGLVWPDPVPDWTAAHEAQAKVILETWKRDIENAWNDKFDLRRDGCGSADPRCCRYRVRVNVTFTQIPVEKMDGNTIVLGTERVRSDSYAWSMGDGRAALAPHEFGHHLGCPDEYKGAASVDTSVNGPDVKLGVDPTSMMGNVPKEGATPALYPVKARHFDIIKQHLSAMFREQKGITMTFTAVPHL